MVTLNQFTVHHIIKDEGDPSASIEMSLNLLPIDDRARYLIEKLDDSYRKSQIDYAIFDTDNGYFFPTSFSNYTNRTNTFLKFSIDTTDELYRIIRTIRNAKGGYLVFAEYNNGLKKFVSIFFIRDTTGLLFRRDTDSSTFLLDPIEHLDLAKLAMACRINIDKFSENNGRYLSFIKRRQSDISKYFLDWVTSVNRENNKIFTDGLYELTRISKLPLNENGIEMQRDVFRKRIFDHISSTPNKIANLFELSNMFFPEERFGEQYLVNLAEERDLNISTEFRVDSVAFKKFIRIEIEADGVHIRFSRDEFGKKISIHPENPDMVIIRSPRLAECFRQETQEWNQQD